MPVLTLRYAMLRPRMLDQVQTMEPADYNHRPSTGRYAQVTVQTATLRYNYTLSSYDAPWNDDG